MEEDKLHFTKDQCKPFIPSFFPYSFEGTSTRDILASTFLEVANSSFSMIPSNPTPQINICNQQVGPPPNFFPLYSHLSSIHSLSDIATHMCTVSKTTKLSLQKNTSIVPFSLFQSQSIPRYNHMYLNNILQMEALPTYPSIQPSFLNNQLGFGNLHLNPYLTNLNPSHNSFNRIFRCSPCGMEFPTAQAYGGHMSYHSRKKKARKKLEKKEREVKKARLTSDSNFLQLVREKIAENVPQKGLTTNKENVTKESLSRKMRKSSPCLIHK